MTDRERSADTVQAPQHSLEGRWALITGAGKRIGRTIATALHTAGANIAIHYFHSADEADALAQQFNTLRPGSAFSVGGDLRTVQALHDIVERTVAQSDRLDILINNASSFYPTPLESVTETDWNDLIDTNLKAPLFLTQAALPHLKAVHGVVINMVDIHAQRPLHQHLVYGSAKAGLAMLTRSLARDLGPDIRVNGVAPGAILWPDAGITEKMEQSVLRQIPLKRKGEPEDIAAAVLYLVRDARYVTGQILAVDGGRSIGW